MGKEQNPALVALSLVLEDASRTSVTPSEDILVHVLELRSRTDSPTPLPPGFYICLSHGLEYFADTQGNYSRVDGDQGRGNIDRELRVRFTRTGGLIENTSTYEAKDSMLTSEDAKQLRQYIEDAQFFGLPDEVKNGDPLPDMYSYTLWIAHGRRNRELRTYDGTGPHDSPALQQLIEWLVEREKQRESERGSVVR